jgi:hypothetical protein
VHTAHCLLTSVQEVVRRNPRVRRTAANVESARGELTAHTLLVDNQRRDVFGIVELLERKLLSFGANEFEVSVANPLVRAEVLGGLVASGTSGKAYLAKADTA